MTIVASPFTPASLIQTVNVQWTACLSDMRRLCEPKKNIPITSFNYDEWTHPTACEAFNETLGPRLRAIGMAMNSVLPAATRNGLRQSDDICQAKVSLYFHSGNSWQVDRMKTIGRFPQAVELSWLFTTGRWSSVRNPSETCSLQFHANLEVAINLDSKRVYRSNNQVHSPK